MSEEKSMPLYYTAEELEKEDKAEKKPEIEKIILDDPAPRSKSEKSESGNGLIKAGKALLVLAAVFVAFEFIHEFMSGVISLGLIISTAAFLVSGSIFYSAGKILNKL